MNIPEFQNDVATWLINCFGKMIALNNLERSFRFLEESLELVQSTGITKQQALQLVDYVYSRPVGETSQEVGGVMITLAALSFAENLSLNDCALDELVRIEKNIEKIRAKHFSKPKNVISPIPGQYPNSITPAPQDHP